MSAAVAPRICAIVVVVEQMRVIALERVLVESGRGLGLYRWKKMRAWGIQLLPLLVDSYNILTLLPV